MKRILVIVLLVAATAGGAAILLSPQWLKQITASFGIGGAQSGTSDTVSQNLLMLLARPDIAGSELQKAVLGDVELALYAVDSGDLYFVHPKTDDAQAVSRSFQRFSADVTKAGIVQSDSGRVDVGSAVLRFNPSREYLIVMPAGNFRVDPQLRLEFTFDGTVFAPTPEVLSAYLADEAIYDGKRRARVPNSRRAFWNHGAFVAKPGEASLASLVEQVVSHAHAESREQRIQAWTSFVCTQIAYSDFEAWDTVETLKRPNEVLMSRESDCSGKAILMASGMEQIQEDYLLCYYRGHVTVAVPRGSFPAANGLSFRWEDREWVLCETAIRGDVEYRIGLTRLERSEPDAKPLYVQRPKSGEILDFSTGLPLESI